MRIDSIGTATPQYALTFEDRFEVAELYVGGDEKDRWFVPFIFEKSTVLRRHSVLLNAASGPLTERQEFFPTVVDDPETLGPSTEERMQLFEERATPLAVAACLQAFAKSSIRPDQITHLVTASCTGFASPGIDIHLIEQLPLPRSTQRTNIGFMGCHAGLNCLRTARAYAQADPDACVLISATELCGLHYQYRGGNDQKVANALFADGSAAAIVLGANWPVPAATDSPRPWTIAGTGSELLPETGECMTWKVTDHGFAMTLSERIPAIIREQAPGWLESWLAGYGLTTADIATWAVHPGGPQILHVFERAMKLSDDHLQHSRAVLAENGNMSSATIFFVLDRLISAGAPTPCVALGFGPGLTIEATLFT